MNEITEKDIEQISKDIDQQGLTYVQLKDEILDHICCEIETEMETGALFNDAYKKVQEEMGRKRIRQIQHETLNLINKKYRRMRRFMYGLGIAAPILVIAGSLFKVMHWPGGGILLTLALFITGMVFLPIFVMTRIRDTRQLDETLPKGLYITGMISGMISILGALFKIQHWPGASISMTVGFIGFGLVFLPMYASYKIKEAKKKNEPINKTLIIGGVAAGALLIAGALFKVMHWPAAGYVLVLSWSVVGVVFLPQLVLNQLKKTENRVNNFFGILLVSTSVAIIIMSLMRADPRFTVEGYLPPEMNFSSNVDYLNNQSELIINAYDFSENDALKEQLGMINSSADELCLYIHTLKSDMINKLAKPEHMVIDEDGSIDLRKLHYKTARFIAYETIAVGENYKLYDLIEAFRKDALLATNNENLKNLINEQLKIVSDEEDPKEAWAEDLFYESFMQSATILSMYQSSVRMIELEILRERMES